MESAARRSCDCRPSRASTGSVAVAYRHEHLYVCPYIDSLKMLGRRELSEAQIRQRLLRKGHEADAVEEAIARLKVERALDDTRVAAAIARTETGIKRRGKLAGATADRERRYCRRLWHGRQWTTCSASWTATNCCRRLLAGACAATGRSRTIASSSDSTAT